MDKAYKRSNILSKHKKKILKGIKSGRNIYSNFSTNLTDNEKKYNKNNNRYKNKSKTSSKILILNNKQNYLNKYNIIKKKEIEKYKLLYYIKKLENSFKNKTNNLEKNYFYNVAQNIFLFFNNLNKIIHYNIDFFNNEYSNKKLLTLLDNILIKIKKSNYVSVILNKSFFVVINNRNVNFLELLFYFINYTLYNSFNYKVLHNDNSFSYSYYSNSIDSQNSVDNDVNNNNNYINSFIEVKILDKIIDIIVNYIYGSSFNKLDLRILLNSYEYCLNRLINNKLNNKMLYSCKSYFDNTQYNLFDIDDNSNISEILIYIFDVKVMSLIVSIITRLYNNITFYNKSIDIINNNINNIDINIKTNNSFKQLKKDIDRYYSYGLNPSNYIILTGLNSYIKVNQESLQKLNLSITKKGYSFFGWFKLENINNFNNNNDKKIKNNLNNENNYFSIFEITTSNEEIIELKCKNNSIYLNFTNKIYNSNQENNSNFRTLIKTSSVDSFENINNHSNIKNKINYNNMYQLDKKVFYLGTIESNKWNFLVLSHKSGNIIYKPELFFKLNDFEVTKNIEYPKYCNHRVNNINFFKNFEGYVTSVLFNNMESEATVIETINNASKLNLKTEYCNSSKENTLSENNFGFYNNNIVDILLNSENYPINSNSDNKTKNYIFNCPIFYTSARNSYVNNINNFSSLTIESNDNNHIFIKTYTGYIESNNLDQNETYGNYEIKTNSYNNIVLYNLQNKVNANVVNNCINISPFFNTEVVSNIESFDGYNFILPFFESISIFKNSFINTNCNLLNLYKIKDLIYMYISVLKLTLIYNSYSIYISQISLIIQQIGCMLELISNEDAITQEDIQSFFDLLLFFINLYNSNLVNNKTKHLIYNDTKYFKDNEEESESIITNILKYIVFNSRLYTKLTDKDFYLYFRLLIKFYNNYRLILCNQFNINSIIINVVCNYEFRDKNNICCYDHFKLLCETNANIIYVSNNKLLINKIIPFFYFIYLLLESNNDFQKTTNLITSLLSMDLSPCIIKNLLKLIKILLYNKDLNLNAKINYQKYFLKSNLLEILLFNLTAWTLDIKLEILTIIQIIFNNICPDSYILSKIKEENLFDINKSVFFDYEFNFIDSNVDRVYSKITKDNQNIITNENYNSYSIKYKKEIIPCLTKYLFPLLSPVTKSTNTFYKNKTSPFTKTLNNKKSSDKAKPLNLKGFEDTINKNISEINNVTANNIINNQFKEDLSDLEVLNQINNNATNNNIYSSTKIEDDIEISFIKACDSMFLNKKLNFPDNYIKYYSNEINDYYLDIIYVFLIHWMLGKDSIKLLDIYKSDIYPHSNYELYDLLQCFKFDNNKEYFDFKYLQYYKDFYDYFINESGENDNKNKYLKKYYLYLSKRNINHQAFQNFESGLDDADIIKNPEILNILMKLIVYSPIALKQKFINDLVVLLSNNSQNCYLLSLNKYFNSFIINLGLNIQLALLDKDFLKSNNTGIAYTILNGIEKIHTLLIFKSIMFKEDLLFTYKLKKSNINFYNFVKNNKIQLKHIDFNDNEVNDKYFSYVNNLNSSDMYLLKKFDIVDLNEIYIPIGIGKQLYLDKINYIMIYMYSIRSLGNIESKAACYLIRNLFVNILDSIKLNAFICFTHKQSTLFKESYFCKLSEYDELIIDLTWIIYEYACFTNNDKHVKKYSFESIDKTELLAELINNLNYHYDREDYMYVTTKMKESFSNNLKRPVEFGINNNKKDLINRTPKKFKNNYNKTTDSNKKNKNINLNDSNIYYHTKEVKNYKSNDLKKLNSDNKNAETTVSEIFLDKDLLTLLYNLYSPIIDNNIFSSINEVLSFIYNTNNMNISSNVFFETSLDFSDKVFLNNLINNKNPNNIVIFSSLDAAINLMLTKYDKNSILKIIYPLFLKHNNKDSIEDNEYIIKIIVNIVIIFICLNEDINKINKWLYELEKITYILLISAENTDFDSLNNINTDIAKSNVLYELYSNTILFIINFIINEINSHRRKHYTQIINMFNKMLIRIIKSILLFVEKDIKYEHSKKDTLDNNINKSNSIFTLFTNMIDSLNNKTKSFSKSFYSSGFCYNFYKNYFCNESKNLLLSFEDLIILRGTPITDIDSYNKTKQSKLHYYYLNKLKYETQNFANLTSNLNNNYIPNYNYIGIDKYTNSNKISSIDVDFINNNCFNNSENLNSNNNLITNNLNLSDNYISSDNIKYNNFDIINYLIYKFVFSKSWKYAFQDRYELNRIIQLQFNFKYYETIILARLVQTLKISCNFETCFNEKNQTNYFTKSINNILQNKQLYLSNELNLIIFNNIKNKAKIRRKYLFNKKEMFLWNGMWSEDLFEYNKNNLTLNIKKILKENSYKYKISNHTTKDLVKPFLVPIYNFKDYFPIINKFDLSSLFIKDTNNIKSTKTDNVIRYSVCNFEKTNRKKSIGSFNIHKKNKSSNVLELKQVVRKESNYFNTQKEVNSSSIDKHYKFIKLNIEMKKSYSDMDIAFTVNTDVLKNFRRRKNKIITKTETEIETETTKKSNFSKAKTLKGNTNKIKSIHYSKKLKNYEYDIINTNLSNIELFEFKNFILSKKLSDNGSNNEFYKNVNDDITNLKSRQVSDEYINELRSSSKSLNYANDSKVTNRSKIFNFLPADINLENPYYTNNYSINYIKNNNIKYNNKINNYNNNNSTLQIPFNFSLFYINYMLYKTNEFNTLNQGIYVYSKVQLIKLGYSIIGNIALISNKIIFVKEIIKDVNKKETSEKQTNHFQDLFSFNNDIKDENKSECSSNCKNMGDIIYNYSIKDNTPLIISIPIDLLYFYSLRRYYYNDTSIELFYSNNKSIVFNFKNNFDRSNFIKELMFLINKLFKTKFLNNKTINNIHTNYYQINKKIILRKIYINKELNSLYNNYHEFINNISKDWSNRSISTFKFLMKLNILSGRSFYDITQYPVFPWLYTPFKIDSNEDEQTVFVYNNSNYNKVEIKDNDYKSSDNNLKHILDLKQKNINNKLNTKEDIIIEERSSFKSDYSSVANINKHSKVYSKNNYINIYEEEFNKDILLSIKKRINRYKLCNYYKLKYYRRDLSKPIGALGCNKRINNFTNNYENSLEEKEDYIKSSTNIRSSQINQFNYEINGLYYYNTHYSTPIYTCLYLNRIFPFTYLSIALQGSRFDDPNRQNISMISNFNNCMTQSTDVRELVPEYFYLPEIYLNINNIDFGKYNISEDLENINFSSSNNNNQCLGNLLAKNSKMQITSLESFTGNEFKDIMYNRLFLETDFCNYSNIQKDSKQNLISNNIDNIEEDKSKNNNVPLINNWVDLIFGYKQKGNNAVQARNLFCKFTYENEINYYDIVKNKENLEFRIKQIEFGQCPNQILFTECLKRISLFNNTINKDVNLNNEYIKIKDKASDSSSINNFDQNCCNNIDNLNENNKTVINKLNKYTLIENLNNLLLYKSIAESKNNTKYKSDITNNMIVAIKAINDHYETDNIILVYNNYNIQCLKLYNTPYSKSRFTFSIYKEYNYYFNEFKNIHKNEILTNNNCSLVINSNIFNNPNIQQPVLISNSGNVSYAKTILM